MDLLERYLAAIARQLPDAQKADVTAELRDVLLSEIEDEESRLGRPLAQEELEALLVRFGHPLTVAGRYRKVQHLIGAEVFPFWWAGLKAALAVVAGIYLVLAALVVFGGRDAAAVADRAAPDLFLALIFTFGSVTLVCALLERFGKAAALQRWRPRELPPAHGKQKSRFERGVEIGLEVVFILWWIGVIQFRHLFPDFGMRVELAPIWKQMFWPILAYSVFELGMNVFGLLRPGFEIVHRSLSLARNLFALAILSIVYRAGHWVEVSWSAWSSRKLEVVQANFDMGMRIGIAATMLVFVALAAIDVWRLWQASRARPFAVAS